MRAHLQWFRPRAPWCALLALVAALPCLAGAAGAEEVVVVGHPGLPVDALSREDLKRIYVGEKTFLGEVKLQPIDYTHAGPVADAFYTAVVGLDASHFHGWWVKEVFHGGGIPPRMVDDTAAVLRFVASEPGGIGFVPAGSLRGETAVKRLYTVSAP